MKAAGLIATLLLASCATTPQPAPTAPPQKPPPEKAEIDIITAPPGGIVIFNGNAIGYSPVKLILDTRPGRRWPAGTGFFHRLEAYWPATQQRACELYPDNAEVPTTILLAPRS